MFLPQMDSDETQIKTCVTICVHLWLKSLLPFRVFGVFRGWKSWCSWRLGGSLWPGSGQNVSLNRI
jgi:hypothetical protein